MKSGRKIPLKIVVLSATGTEHAPDPFVFIVGGPGGSSTGEVPNIAKMFARIRERRDLVFVDQRGTGGSYPLKCEFYNPADMQSYLGSVFPLDDVRKCREQLERRADLTLYTTAIAIDDLDQVRAALGYERLNLLGVSYGTRAALVYLKRYPNRVRTVTLQSVLSTSHFVPLDFAQSAERALQGVLAECAGDEPCNRSFPNLRAETKAVFDRLQRGPVEVEVTGFGAPPNAGASVGGRSETAGSRTRVGLSRDRAAEAIRFMLYAPFLASRVPLLLHLASQGDFAPLVQAVLAYRRTIVSGVSTGLYLSITCAEDVPWIKPNEGERLAANTFVGDYILRELRKACGLWPRATIPKDHKAPTKASAPVLIITGELDPTTPPANGDAVARYLPNSIHVVVPHGAHDLNDLEGIDCLERLQTEFVERGTAKGLDTACVKNIKRKGFVLKRQNSP